jgi:DNA-3-methyladenine glycosylase I
MNRCPWCLDDPIMKTYHDEEWGLPVHDELKHFEFLFLECFQAGLSWKTILHKREAFCKAFDSFNYRLIAEYDEEKIHGLMQDSGIIRNRRKIEAVVHNAGIYMNVQKAFGSFDRYIWSFTDRKVVNNRPASMADIPTRTELSDQVSKDMKNQGFKFVGSVTIYAHLQAIGVINDHLTSCSTKVFH